MPAHNALTKILNFSMLADLMRKFAIVIALLLAGALRAQTPVTGTQTANTAANPNRRISLTEAVKMALERNLDIQITRFEPTLSQFDIAGAYAAYEPRLTLNATRSM